MRSHGCRQGQHLLRAVNKPPFDAINHGQCKHSGHSPTAESTDWTGTRHCADSRPPRVAEARTLRASGILQTKASPTGSLNQHGLRENHMCYCLKLNLGSFCHLMMNNSRTPSLCCPRFRSPKSSAKRCKETSHQERTPCGSPRSGRHIAVSSFGKIDVLVKNAGIFPTGSLETLSIEVFDETFSVNVRSVFRGV